MHSSNAGVSVCIRGRYTYNPTPATDMPEVYRCIGLLGGDTPIHPVESDTATDTKSDTVSLKALATAYLQRGKAIQSPIQEAIHPPKQAIAKCITPICQPEPPFTRSNHGANIPSWIRPAVPGEVLDDTRERRCKGVRCGAVFTRQAGTSDESWSNKHYCSGECWSGKPFVKALDRAPSKPLDAVNEPGEVLQ